MVKGYIGTYTYGSSEGIYSFEVDNDGVLKNPTLFKTIQNSKYMTNDENYIYTLFDEADKSGVCVIDYNGNTIDSILFEEKTSAYICLFNGYIYTANYHLGNITKLSFKDNKLNVVKSIHIGDSAGCHEIIIYKDKLLIPCLFLDEVFVLNEDLDVLNRFFFPIGSGPRHGVIANDKLYLVSELSNELFTFDINGEDFIMKSQISILPDNQTHQKGTAAIRLGKNKDCLYISTRGLGIITVVDIKDAEPKITQYYKLDIETPRDILNIYDDKYLLVVSRTNDELASYKIENNQITEKISNVSIPAGITIVLQDK